MLRASRSSRTSLELLLSSSRRSFFPSTSTSTSTSSGTQAQDVPFGRWFGGTSTASSPSASTSASSPSGHTAADAPQKKFLPKFFKDVSVTVSATDPSKYEIVFDDKHTLKSPAKSPFVIPSKALAHGIAAEWAWQKNRVDPETMPLMQLAATAIDQPQSAEVIASSLCAFLPTDPVLCREDDVTKSDLVAAQNMVLQPYLDFVNMQLGTKLRASTSIVGAAVSKRDVGLVYEYLMNLDAWKLCALMELSSACKSVCMAIGGASGGFSVEQVIRASRVEEDYQIEQWGLVEGGHDIDLADSQVRIRSPMVFLDLLNERKTCN
jgi:ATP synthase F1 complex assembly factor 2